MVCPHQWVRISKGGNKTRPRRRAPAPPAAPSPHHGGPTMTAHAPSTTTLKSPACGGLRGPTYLQPRCFPHPTISQIPHCRADFAPPCPASSGEEEEELKTAKQTYYPPRNRVTQLHVTRLHHIPLTPPPHLPDHPTTRLPDSPRNRPVSASSTAQFTVSIATP